MPINKDIFLGTILDPVNKFIALNSPKGLYEFSKSLNSFFPNEEVHLFVGLWYSHEDFKYVSKLALRILKNKISFPKIKVHILCNTVKEKKILGALGINSVYCNHNAFLDENVFKIIEGIDKRYTCVYNAVLSGFKRHHLAAKIKGLALITYNFKNSAYKQSVDKVLTDHHWLNYPDSSGGPKFLNTEHIVNIYNASKAGLALSAVEGAMYAAGEYLLCGIPVVSTKSKGGRDVFFNDGNCIIAKDNADSVAIAVDEILAMKLDPTKIRARMLQDMAVHRVAFVNYVNNIYRKKNLALNLNDTWDTWFVNKLRNEETKEAFCELLKANQTNNT